MLHTPVHMSMMVKLPARNFIVGTDIARTKNNLEPIPCPADQDVLAAWRSIKRAPTISSRSTRPISGFSTMRINGRLGGEVRIRNPMRDVFSA
jgi:hypothetical protein